MQPLSTGIIISLKKKKLTLIQILKHIVVLYNVF